MDHADVVDQIVDELIVCTETAGRCQNGALSPQMSLQQQIETRAKLIDTVIKAEAADKPWRRSKMAYFHPNARPSQYIRDVLSDPYFDHVKNWYPPAQP